ncbi:unnamed protein product [Sphagnum troendelagicum]
MPTNMEELEDLEAPMDVADAGDGDIEEFTSLAERLKARNRRKPSYAEVEAAEDEYWAAEEEVEEEEEEEEAAVEGAAADGDDEFLEVLKMEQSEDFCSICHLGGDLLCCDNCTAVYHLGCLSPPLKVVPRGKWSCPRCLDPLGDVEKILDMQLRPLQLPQAGREHAGNGVPPITSGSLVKHYLVKWKSRSYLHCSWVSAVDLERSMKVFSGLRMKLNHFHRQLEAAQNQNTPDEDWVPVRPEWTTVDRILDTRCVGDVREYNVKWKELGYDEVTWEVEDDVTAFQAEIDKYKSIMARPSKKRKRLTLDNNKDLKRQCKDFKPYTKTPNFLVGGSLHSYQLEGLNFLRFAWQQSKHVILADEMGLGKTIQSISLLASLAAADVVELPHLVVAPLSTLRNWEREFATWAPHMNVVMYVGSSKARAILRHYEFFFPKKIKKAAYKKEKGKKKLNYLESKQERIKFDVLLTSYEMVNLDTFILKSLHWECLIVDEGHRLKNKDSKLFQTLQTFSTRHRILLTGTPLQNNLDELFMLMHFLDAGKFSSLEEFQQEFRDINQEEQVQRLHKMLAPHLLRRVKKDVMKELPPKKELILRVELSALQKEYYRAILTRNYQILSRNGGPQISLNNVVMELRKLCGHPYLLDGMEPQTRNQSEANRQLLMVSGKMVLLEKMMSKLKLQGHRVLIYSQFTRMLDILEDWLHVKKWGYERIDGKINGAERQVRIDRFNAPNSSKFCFLLSTRAGGLGINLATADTVIIYDSDWNPHADLQAMARAHRLGQTNKVMIFRLVTRGTIEERMMQLTKKKMVLEHLVVGRMKTQVLNQEELDDILRYGAKELFTEGDEAGKAGQIHYDDVAIERLLDRSQVVADVENVDDDEDNGLLNAFKVANYEVVNEDDTEEAEREAQVELDAKTTDNFGASHFWDRLLKDRALLDQQEQVLEELGKGKRSRKQVLQTGLLYEQDDDNAGMVEISSDEEADWTPPVQPELPIRIVEQRIVEPRIVEPCPLMEGEGSTLKVLGFNHRQRSMFVHVLMRFGLGDFSWCEFIPRLKPKTMEEIKEYGTLFLSHIAEDINDSPTFYDGVPKEGLRIQDVLVRLAILHLIRDKVKALIEDPSMPLFSKGAHTYRYYSLRNTKVWKEEHDRKLLYAICMRHGYGRWLDIVEDTQLGLQPVVRGELLLRGVDDSTAAGPSRNRDMGGEDAPITLEDEVQIGIGADKDEKEAYMQKRMVDFIKRRVLLLEKVLNAEYHKVFLGDQGAVEELPQCMTSEGAMRTNYIPSMPVVAHKQTISREERPAPPTKPFPISVEEMEATAFDNDASRLKVAQIYNKMCHVVNENEGDTAQAYGGNKSAGLRLRKALREIEILCVEMRNTLFEQPLRKLVGMKQTDAAQECEAVVPALEEVDVNRLEPHEGDPESDDGPLDDEDVINADKDPDSDIEGGMENARSWSGYEEDDGFQAPERTDLTVDPSNSQTSPLHSGCQDMVEEQNLATQTGNHNHQPIDTVVKFPVLTPQHDNTRWPPAVVYLDS